MIKKILFALLLFVCSLTCWADGTGGDEGTRVYLQENYNDPLQVSHPVKKAPARRCNIYIDDYTLTSPLLLLQYKMIINNESLTINEQLVYTGKIELPEILKGIYQIQFIKDNICFYGYINL